MARKPRSEVYRPGEQAIVHVMNRCVRKCFNLGLDKKTGKNYTYRRRKFEKELQKSVSGFAIDMLSFALMDNHFHLMLRSRPDVVNQWDDREVVRQWHKLCPQFKNKDGSPIENPGDELVIPLTADVDEVAKWRERLSDISWFMKLISERIARWCNAEDNIPGHFWEGRFKSVLLLDERAILTCSMYVDLNRIKAELDKSLETSDYTSIQRRLQAFVIHTSMRGILAEQVQGGEAETTVTTVVLGESAGSADYIPDAGQAISTLPDAHLAPIHIDEKNDPIGPHLSSSGTRCSDKGFLPITQEQYVELLRWTADQLRNQHGGRTFDDSPPLLTQLQIESDVWCKLVTQFTDLFFTVAGMPESIDQHRSCVTGKRFNMPHKTREMLSV